MQFRIREDAKRFKGSQPVKLLKSARVCWFVSILNEGFTFLPAIFQEGTRTHHPNTVFIPHGPRDLGLDFFSLFLHVLPVNLIQEHADFREVH